MSRDLISPINVKVQSAADLIPRLESLASKLQVGPRGREIVCRLSMANYEPRLCVFRFLHVSNPEIAAEPFYRLVQYLHEAPVFLVAVAGTSRQASVTGGCVLVEWLLYHAVWIDRVSHQQPIRLDLGDLQSADAFASGVFETISRTSPYIYVPTPTFPITLTGLFEHIHDPSAVEVPAEVNKLVRADPGLVTADSYSEYLHRLWTSPDKFPPNITSNPAVKRWLGRRALAHPPSDTLFGRHLVQDFAGALRSFRKDDWFPMPPFQWRYISTYRVLFALFPQSLRLLRRVLLERPDDWRTDDKRSAIKLAEALVFSHDTAVSAQACELLIETAKRYMTLHFDSYEHYTLAHEAAFARARFDGRKANEQSRAVLHAYHDELPLPQVTGAYYGCSIRNSMNIISSTVAHPTSRSEAVCGILSNEIMDQHELSIATASNGSPHGATVLVTALPTDDDDAHVTTYVLRTDLELRKLEHRPGPYNNSDATLEEVDKYRRMAHLYGVFIDEEETREDGIVNPLCGVTVEIQDSAGSLERHCIGFDLQVTEKRAAKVFLGWLEKGGDETYRDTAEKLFPGVYGIDKANARCRLTQYFGAIPLSENTKVGLNCQWRNVLARYVEIVRSKRYKLREDRPPYCWILPSGQASRVVPP